MHSSPDTVARIASVPLPSLSKHRREQLRDAADRCVMAALRMIVVVAVIYGGGRIVRNVTHAACEATGRQPPLWTQG